MRKQCVALFVSFVLALSMIESALGQTACQIANDFSGSSQTAFGDYSINVVPGSTGTLSALCPSFVTSYNWAPGGQQTASISVTAPSTGSQSYSLVGCDTTSSEPFCFQPVTITLVVNPQAPDCTLSASPNPVVSGQTVTFTATCNPAAQQIVYTDLSGNTKTSSSLTFTDTAPAVTTQTVRTVFFHGISTAGGTGIERSITVTIDPVPAVPPPTNCTLSANPNPVSLNKTFTLTAACAGGGTVQTFAFSGPSGPIGSPGAANTATVTATTLGTQTYTVRASNAGGQATATTSVTVLPAAPSGCTLTANPNPVFVGQQTTLNAQCTSGDPPTTYTFTLPDGHTVTQSTGTLVTVGTAAGPLTYSVVAANAGGSAPAATTTLTVQQTGCTITASRPNPVPRGTSVTLNASCTPPVSAYQWTAGGSAIPGQTTASITVSPTATTAYAVSGTAVVGDAPVTVTGQYTIVVAPAASIANIVGTTITGVPGRPLSRTLDVRVTDTSGQPVAGEFVTWSIVNPGPSSGSFGQSSTGPTNAQGVTTNTFTMGTDPGGRILRACLASQPSVCADFTIVVGGTQIAALPGAPLVGGAGQTLRELVVQVRDTAGNPVAGETVAWSVVNPGPNPGTFASPTTGPTDAQGVTRNTFTMGGDPNGRTLRACLVSSPAVCTDFVVRSLTAVVERPATKIMSPIAETAVNSALLQMQNVRFRLDQLRLRRNPAVLEALRVSVAGKPLPSWSAFALAPKDGKPQKGGGAAADADPFERLGFFINGDVEIGRQSSTGVQNGYDLRTRGVTAGVDYRLPGESVIGGAVGLLRARTDLADEGGDQSASGYSFNAYGSFVPTPNTYLDVIVHAGHNKYDTRRRDPSDTGAPVDYTSNTKGRQLAMAVTAGTDINRGPIIMNPYLRVDYVDAKVNGFSESGDASALTVRDLNLRSTVVTAGGQFSYTMSTSWGVLVPNTRLELQRRVQGDSHNVTAALVADGTISSQTQLQSVDRNYGNVSIGASAVFPRGVNGFVNVERLFGRESYSNTKYTLGVRVEF